MDIPLQPLNPIDELPFEVVIESVVEMVRGFESRLNKASSAETMLVCSGDDCPALVLDKLSDVEEFVPYILDALADLTDASSQDELAFALEDLREAMGGLLDSMEGVKATRFDDYESVKPLLLDAMSRVVKDVVALINALEKALHESRDASSRDESVIDFQFFVELKPEIDALEEWARTSGDLSHAGWRTLMTAFGRPWRFDQDA